MEKIKISELFYSIQGEGKYMGVPSIFLRTFGCNFKCAGFGMLKGESSVEANNIASAHINSGNKLYKDYKELPLVSTGCDSYASWHPAFRDLSPYFSIDEIVEKMMKLLPHNRWVDEHLVITGGEPLLGWQQVYSSLLKHELMENLKELTFETNGTQHLYPETRHFLLNWTLNNRYHNKRGYDKLTFSVSPKLSVSGESWEDAIKPDVIIDYEDIGYTYLKFVVSNEDDINEAEEAVNEYRKVGFKGPVYIMPVGGVDSVYSLNNRNVAQMAMRKGWRYSDRLQVPLFKNEWGT